MGCCCSSETSVVERQQLNAALLNDGSEHRSSEIVREPALEVCRGSGGHKKLRLLHGSGASCEVYLSGATITSYRTPRNIEMLYTPKVLSFGRKQTLRGGVGVLFPFDGQLNTESCTATSASASLEQWEIDRSQSKVQPDMTITAVLLLGPTSNGRGVCPPGTRLEYRITLTSWSLQAALTVTNDSIELLTFNCALPTYLRVGAASDVTVGNLRGGEYIDHLQSGAKRKEGKAQVKIGSGVDRLYLAGTNRDGLGVQARTEVSCGGPLATVEATCHRAANASWANETPSPDLLLWNPGKDYSPPDLKDGHASMVCVGPAILSSPGELINGRITLTQTIVPDDKLCERTVE